jgi:RNA polymerase sigma-70 factor (ECF subfamily)
MGCGGTLSPCTLAERITHLREEQCYRDVVTDAHAGADTPAATRDESSLVQALKSGDSRAFETLVRLHGGRMLSVARRFVANEEDARDVVQDAFISAFRSIDRFAGQSKLSTWLHRITVNTALMKLRSRRRRPEESIEPLLPACAEDGHHALPVAEWPEAADLLHRKQIAARVRNAIDRLPETYRTVLLLRDIEELTTDETARMLDLTVNAVKIRLHRARQALRTLLDSDLHEAPE